MRPFTLTTILLAGCAPLSLVPSAQAGPLDLLPPVIVREGCFASPRSEFIGGQGAVGYGGGGLGGSASGRAYGGSAPPPAPQSAPSSPQSRGPALRKSADMSEADGVAVSGNADEGARMPAAEPRLQREEQEGAQVPWRRPTEPQVEWGGVVHLSNDDSMSLASAQRLLFALEQNASVPLQHIRPHELLNYFTFDTAAPDPGELFGVHASAERVGSDELSLALTVRGATPPRQPLDLTLLVDRSGSMRADGRMSYTRRALTRMSDQLRQGDRVDLVLFDDVVCTPLENFVVGRDDPALLSRVLAQMEPRNSTDLDRGLKEAYRVARAHTDQRGRDQRVMVFTDALLNTGDVNPDTVSEIGKALDQHDIRLTGVGVGREFRDDVLDKLTEKGKGAYVFLGSERVVDRLFGSGFEALVQTIAQDVRFSLDLPPSLGMKRFYGEEMSTRAEEVQPVAFHAGSSQVFLQDLHIRDGRLDPADRLVLTMSWDDLDTMRRVERTFTTTVGAALQSDPHNARKAHALMAWTDILTERALGGDACGAPLSAYRRTLPGLGGDAEIAYVSELIGRWCHEPEPLASWTAPAFTRIRLDSDQPITEVALRCGGESWSEHVSSSDTVATFQARPGTCDVTLYGTVPLSARVQVASTGGDLRCVVRGGRVNCL